MNPIDFFDPGYPQSNKKKKHLNKKTAKKDTETIRTNRNHLELTTIHPRTTNQEAVFDHYNYGQNIILHGTAGTGKSFLAMYLGLRDVLVNKNYNKVIIVRSAVASREVGFMPGKLNQKIEVFEAPYYSIANELFGRGDAYELLKQKGFVEFLSTSFVRGITLNDCVVILDEVQNLTFHEIDSVVTRIGDNARLMICGDLRQDDLSNNGKTKEVTGFKTFLDVASRIKQFSDVAFTPDDIQRSDFIKAYILAKEQLGI
jgi:predicted ribonuclease YlaK